MTAFKFALSAALSLNLFSVCSAFALTDEDATDLARRMQAQGQPQERILRVLQQDGRDLQSASQIALYAALTESSRAELVVLVMCAAGDRTAMSANLLATQPDSEAVLRTVEEFDAGTCGHRPTDSTQPNLDFEAPVVRGGQQSRSPGEPGVPVSPST